jgi:hypothetical protein
VRESRLAFRDESVNGLGGWRRRAPSLDQENRDLGAGRAEVVVAVERIGDRCRRRAEGEQETKEDQGRRSRGGDPGVPHASFPFDLAPIIAD